MMPFPEVFLEYLIKGSLVLAAGAAITLITLLVRDHKEGKVW